jgi:hypothetical protein
MATAYLFLHTLTQAEADSLNANTPVQLTLNFPALLNGTNFAVSVTAEDGSNSGVAPYVVGISDVTGSGFLLNYASFSLGSNPGDIIRFHVIVQQVQ